MQMCEKMRGVRVFCSRNLLEEWNSVEVPSCRGSSRWINGCVDKRSGFGEEDDSNAGEEGERELVLVFSALRKVKHDAWMNDLFWGDATQT